MIRRIGTLSENSKAQWGKMTVSQMIKHSVQFDEMTLGKKKYKREFFGKIFGKIALKNMVKDENPMKRNMPTVPSFKMKEDVHFSASERDKWMTLLGEYAHCTDSTEFVHPFFGQMTKEQVGMLTYKHIDHHLRQFNS